LEQAVVTKETGVRKRIRKWIRADEILWKQGNVYGKVRQV